MTDDEAIKELVQLGCFAADWAILKPGRPQGTRAEETRIGIRAALESWIENGLIALPTDEQWSNIDGIGFSFSTEENSTK